MIVVVAEKPSVARAIHKTLRSNNVKSNVRVFGLRGHVLDYDLKSGYEWGKVDPFKIFQLREFQPIIRDKKSYRDLVNTFKDNLIEELVIATDNDPEGELIGWEIVEIIRNFNSFAKISRMRFNTVSEEELWWAWQNREEGLNWRWVWRAAYRRDFDLITGAAFTRLLTSSVRKKGFKGLISWGSCQIPTLNYIVEREEKIRSFIPTSYWVIVGKFKTSRGEVFEARSSKIENRGEAQSIFDKLKNMKEGVVERYVEEIEVIKRPKPLRTDEMLRDLHKITGVSASNILKIAEELYSNGYISYPRTDTDQWLKGIDFNKIKLTAIKGLGLIYGELPREPKPLNGYRNDGAHPPIYPISPYSRDNTLKWKVWEYIARRFLANVFSIDARILKQRGLIKVGEAILKTSGSKIEEMGFYKIYPYFKPETKSIPKLSVNEKLEVMDLKLVEESTKPPNRLTESELLKLMEKDGIGTDATRAEYPKIIIDRGYAVKNLRIIKPTELGMNLISSLREVDLRLVSPQTRRIIEEYMDMISRGEKKYDEALDETLKIYSTLYRQLESKIHSIADKLAGSAKNV
ncbi:MAG: DNA topoisomerase [Thaumarchaeota archaeon]|jgi:DNA topoisomerase IA|nr:DNA topoisomerase [Candidatus Geocrenenecus arthurdayi]